jgi:hypothetical protein
MRPETYRTAQLVRWFEKMRILAWERIAQALGKPSRITVFRKLAQLGARASYSHRGRFHTLDRLVAYDKNGLWSFHGVRFSRHGTLEKTIAYLVEHSPEGYFASELEVLVQVRVHNTLAHLYALGRLDREQLVDQYLYLSPTTGKQQLEKRYESIRRAQGRRPASRPEVPAELRESLDFLLSVLNEKQRRLYLGLESLRLGHGGDSQIARMAGVDVKTVAQGRRQLLATRLPPSASGKLERDDRR